ncbi:hypothetical protein E2562_018972 [Oryza meyeriana var. granulata]|uniref:Uncharacterized protein n=1 Tax=Oryza meyeriana var. granulata TaxID=110450 RepID=A0A6G1DKS6_9ORYZ|nr:hypothetical protein E2562_018972 [Oryza meyeriana var. granulata]
MAMAASVLAASSSSPLALASWRWRPPSVAGAAAGPGANPRLALRLSAAASPPRALPAVTGKSRAVASVSRARCSVAPLGGSETEQDAAPDWGALVRRLALVAPLGGSETEQDAAPDWGALVRRLALGALGCAVLGCGAAVAAEDSIKASGFGLRVAASLRRLGWPDEAVVFTLATLPVIELRGAIPVGYWMRLDPIRLTVLSVLGFDLINMTDYV